MFGLFTGKTGLRMSAAELEQCGWKTQADADQARAKWIADEREMNAACVSLHALSDRDFLETVARSHVEHPAWWSCVNWMETVKWEVAYRADAAKLRHYMKEEA